MREAEGSLDGGTLTAQGGQLLLQQLQEMAVNKQDIESPDLRSQKYFTMYRWLFLF